MLRQQGRIAETKRATPNSHLRSPRYCIEDQEVDGI